MSNLSHEEKMAASRNAIDAVSNSVKMLETIYADNKPVTLIHISFEQSGQANCIINGGTVDLVKLYAALLHSATTDMPHILAMAVEVALSGEHSIEVVPNEG